MRYESWARIDLLMRTQIAYRCGLLKGPCWVRLVGCMLVEFSTQRASCICICDECPGYFDSNLKNHLEQSSRTTVRSEFLFPVD